MRDTSYTMTHNESEPAAYLFGNGNAMYFDEQGEQIPEMQRHGLSGVHLFREQFSDAPVYWAMWGEQQATEIHENVLDYIVRPPGSTPNIERMIDELEASKAGRGSADVATIDDRIYSLRKLNEVVFEEEDD